MMLLLTLLFPVFGFAQQTINANLYDLKSNQQKKLFTLDIDVSATQDGAFRTQAQYRDLDGKMAVTETGRIKGADVQSYEIRQEQTGEVGRFRVENGKIFFEYEGKGRKKSSEEKVSGFVLSTSNFNAFVATNWDQLVQGKALDVRFAVWDRLETVGFTLQKRGEMEKEGEKWMELRMKPTSFVIAALVDPIHLWYSHSDKQLRLMKGRVAPKQMRDGKWKDLDAEVIYTKDQKSVSK
ncbi:hypothetical protein EZJ49_10225 [Bdellovibrio bacteriovorus]|uniref:hypothetical protein n=1 Tax=Bdellovibrio bacteriovorus TaxID=959 RepID=UPI0021D055AB|nr:hypothetical protein [Bdellovibrio bacteriovorus]UXR63451.1 hypothetical protein EZJ49_10225 [Bdellovibrio bacteriovorus]